MSLELVCQCFEVFFLINPFHTLMDTPPFGSLLLILNSRMSSLWFHPITLVTPCTTLNPSFTSRVSVTFTQVMVTFFFLPKLHVSQAVSLTLGCSQWLSCSRSSSLPFSDPIHQVRSQRNVCGPFLKQLRVRRIYQIRRNILRPTVPGLQS